MSFSALWQLVKHSMKSALKRGSRDSKRRQPLRIHRKPGTRPLLEVLEDRTLMSAGALDASFGNGGTVTTDFGSENNNAYSVAVDTSGNIVVAGTTYENATGDDFAVARYKPNGTLDASFGNGGKVMIDFGSQYDVAVGVAVLADGKVVIAGHTYTGTGFDFAVARLTNTGQLDTSFNGNGKQTIDFGSVGSDSTYGTGVAVQADGSVVEVGTAYENQGTFLAVTRLTKTGQLDTSFNGTGKQTINFGSLFLQADGVAVQADGRVVVAGTTDGNGTGNFVVGRLTNTGQLDTSFNGVGTQTISFGSDTEDVANGVALLADGSVVVAGASFNYQSSTSYDFAVARLTNSGQLDTNFGSGGRQTIDFGGTTDYASPYGPNVVVQSNGSVVVAGSSQGSTGTDFALARLTNTGQLDGSFGSGGKVTTKFASSDAFGSGVALQGDGKIVVAGNTYNSTTGNTDFAVARYITDPVPNLFVLSGTTLDQSFIGDTRKQAVDTGNAAALLLDNQAGQFLLTLYGESLNYVGGGSAIKGVGYFTFNVANGTKIANLVYDFTVTYYDDNGYAIVLDAFSAVLT